MQDCARLPTDPFAEWPADAKGIYPAPATAASACTYDAWDRLPRVFVDVNSNGAYDAGTDVLVARYEYDGLGRRVKKHYDSQAPAAPDGVDSYRHYYYNRSWQVVETRKAANENDEPETLQPDDCTDFHDARFNGRRLRAGRP